MTDQSIDDFLEHFGVKGMHWGIVNEEETVASSLTPLEKKVRSTLGVSEQDSTNLNDKYGSKSNQEVKPKGLTPNQKKLILIGGIAAAVVGVSVANHYLGRNASSLETQETATEFAKFWADYGSASRRANHLSIEDIDKMGDALTFPKGAVFKRVSNTVENTVRPGGFFGAFKPEDVERYKAVLPTFWKQWGESSSDSGFIVNLKSNGEVRTPSVREAFDIWERMITSDPKSAVSMNVLMRNSNLSPREIALKTFGDLGTTWREQDMNDVTRRYFDEVKKLGYNALIDHNDAGKLADSPIRFLSGEMFDIIGHDELSVETIKFAQENITRLSHMTSAENVNDFLEHFGVKGMHWGIRKERPTSDNSTNTASADYNAANNLVEISPKGSITLKKGAQLQRVVRRSDGMLFKAADDVGDITYASFSKIDNLTYETMFGRRQSVFNKQASDILTMTAKKDLKSPSPSDTAALYFKVLKENPAARREVEAGLRDKGSTLLFSKQDVEAGIQNPKSERAYGFYANSFEKGNYKSDTPSVANAAFLKEVQKAGYNMLLDPSDSSSGITNTPVILLDAKNTVDISARRVVDKVSAKSARKALAEVEKVQRGKTFMEELGYNL